jgi:molybdopterin molybdotransferase
LERAFQEDVVITTGGISVGKYDLVGATLNELKVDLKVSKVNIKPGKPFAYGVAPNGTPVFCLPGNPVSSVVTFVRFVQPAILRMMGGKDEQQSVCRAILEHDIPKNDTKEHLLRGVLRLGSETPSVRLTGSQSSGVLTSLVKANCLVILPPESRTFLAGESVEIQML